MADVQEKAEALANQLQERCKAAEHSANALAVESQSWGADKTFLEEITSQAFLYWKNQLDPQRSSLEAKRPLMLQFPNWVNSRHNAFLSLLLLHPKVLLKQGEIILLSFRYYLKLIFFMLIRIAIVLMMMAIFGGMIYLIILLVEYLGKLFKI
jgi:hypothetical protein